MGLLDDVERMEEKDMPDRLARVEKNQEEIIKRLNQILKELRVIRADQTTPGNDRMVKKDQSL